jgi:hypothetical protein
MSKGLGEIQQALLAVLADHKPRNALQLACDVYKVKRSKDGKRYCSAAQHAAVRRALQGLKRIGHVDGERRYGGRQWQLWFVHKEGACSDWPPKSIAEEMAELKNLLANGPQVYGPPTWEQAAKQAAPHGAIAMCRDCGGWIFRRDAKFCSQCGVPIEWSKPETRY